MPVATSRQDVLTDGTARQVLAHNCTWARLCQPETYRARCPAEGADGARP